MDTGFRDDIGIQAIAKVDRVDVVTVERKNPVSIGLARGELLWERHGIGGKKKVGGKAYHSRSLYMMVKNT